MINTSQQAVERVLGCYSLYRNRGFSHDRSVSKTLGRYPALGYEQMLRLIHASLRSSERDPAATVYGSLSTPQGS